jgi:hypothetical protein
MILILGAAAGCAGETETPATGTPPSTSPPPVARPGPGPAAPKIDADKAKPADSSEKPAPPSKPGADKKGDETPKVEGPKAENAKTDAGAVKLTDEEQAAIKELPAAEQPVALAQAVCPVSTENLGSMGKPLKVTAEGRTFYLCCKNCEKELKANPKAVIAKLDKKGKD